MNTEIDHVFVCCSAGAPEAEALRRLGLREGSPNTHPGQGTACRRFFFDNAYLELVWVNDPQEAQSGAVLPTGLWDRWCHRGETSCPFGVVLRAAADRSTSDPPFPTWEYRPPYLPPEVSIGVARDTPLSEPGLFYFRASGRSWRGSEPVAHEVPVSEITGVTILMPIKGELSLAAAGVHASGVVAIQTADRYLILMELDFNQRTEGEAADMRPDLPLLLRW